MMTKARLILDKRTPGKGGECPIRIEITHKGRFYIGTQKSVLPKNWIDGKVVLPAAERHTQDTLNKFLKNRLDTVDKQLMQLDITGVLPGMSNKELRAHIEGISIEDAPLLFRDAANKFISDIERKKTRESCELTLKHVADFANLSVLTFEQINYAWLKDFEKHLKMRGLAVNSISIYIRNIRTIFNDAIDRDIIPISLYPFRKFKIAKEATKKRSLTIAQLRQLRDYDCEAHQRQYIDIFMLIFYLCGINIIDLYNLKKITPDGYIEYKRAKTGKLYKIKIEPEAMEIIERYKGVNYLLNIGDRYANHADFTKKLNLNLKQIGEVKLVNRKHGKLGKKERTPIFPELTSYWARHTWATIASEIDIPKDTIAQALGHGNNTVTDIYIKPSQKKIDEANRRVLDAIKEGQI